MDAPQAPTYAASAATVAEWLRSPYLQRLALRTAYMCGLTSDEAPDLFQEVCLALWIAGPDRLVNATWVVQTARHKAIDIFKKRARLAREKASAEGSCRPADRDADLPRLLRARAALLPKCLHDFYLLRYEEGLSQREIAKRLGLCRSSVRCLDQRCLRMVKGRLGIPGASS